MGSDAMAGATPGHPDEPAIPHADARARSRLACGILVGPLYLALGVAQGLVRDGFDFARHPLSVLANGPGGWVQTATFVASGLMVVCAATGIRRVLGPGGRALSWSLCAFGAGMLAGAIFPADPVDGFPPGTPEGFPTTISTTGLLHFAAGGLGFLALALSCFFGARVMSRRGVTWLAVVSLLAGLSVVIGFFGGMIPGLSLGVAGIWFAVVAGWAWLTILSLHLYREAARPGHPGGSASAMWSRSRAS
jgi:hypothetical protein